MNATLAEPAEHKPFAYYEQRARELVPVEQEIKAIERAFGLTLAVLREPCRRAERAHARWEMMAMLRARGWSLSRIGTFLSRDHTTVIYGLDARAAAMRAAALGGRAAHAGGQQRETV